MKMDKRRNIFIKTKADAAHPVPETIIESRGDQLDESLDATCSCRTNKFIKCIIPRNHFFHSKDRARIAKDDKPYVPNMPGDKLRGEQPVRVQYGYKINEAKILPSKLLGIPAEL